MFESTKQIIKAPAHLNVLDVIKCTGYFMLTVIVITCKLAGYIVKLTLKFIVTILKLVTKFVTWLLAKMDK